MFPSFWPGSLFNHDSNPYVYDSNRSAIRIFDILNDVIQTVAWIGVNNSASYKQNPIQPRLSSAFPERLCYRAAILPLYREI